MNPLTQSKNATILPVLIALTLGCFALSPKAQAICQDGCDTTNFNTFQGDDALLNNTTGIANTAIGAFALISNTSGSYNTAIGDEARNQHNRQRKHGHRVGCARLQHARPL